MGKEFEIMTDQPVILIFGATGGLGQHVVKECEKREINHHIVGRDFMGHQHSYALSARDSGGPCSAINCIGWGDVPGCDKDPIRSYKDNVDIVSDICILLNRVSRFVGHRPHLVHMSTNDVFCQNEKVPYRFIAQDETEICGFSEGRRPRPKGTYAEHKYLAERVLQSIYPVENSCIVRGTFMSPTSKSKGGNTFYYEAWKKFSESSDMQPLVVSGYTNQRSCPVSVDTLASVLVSCALEETIDLKHVSSSSDATRYDILRHMQDVVGNPNSILEPISYSGEGPRYACLEPVEHNLIEECAKFVKLCEQHRKGE